MKTLLFILLLSFNCQLILAQPGVMTAKEGDYIKNDSLKFLEGKWMGVNNKNDTLRVILKFTEKVKIGLAYIDYVAGWHEYIEDGLIESSSMKDTFDTNLSSIYINISIYKNLTFSLTDWGKLSGTASGIIITNPYSPDEIIWKVGGTSGPDRLRLNGVPPPPMERSKLTVTREWKMVRVKN